MSIFVGSYIIAKLAGSVETFAGGKVETLKSLLIANNPGEMWKKQMSIEDAKAVAKKTE